MPAITPSYLYTLFAVIAVSSILTVSFMNYANAVRTSLETRKMKNLLDQIAAKATELLTLTMTTNAKASTFIQAPNAMGEKQYWIRLENDSTRAWLEGGFGNTPTENTELRAYIPNCALVSGYYISGYGAICLTCSVDNGAIKIQILSASQNGG
ncbi:hypothetical protein KEJ45_06575 [Candidatus Bathyarchaeota archaeon]|nr:hypothetical protein [Candidatus Bathyarchaeota archaeon]